MTARAAGGAKSGLLILVPCLAVVAWLVFVPLAALVYFAFTESTSFAAGGFTFGNFAEAYLHRRIGRLFANSLVYALGSSVLSFALGAATAWIVERTDAPLRRTFHAAALLSFAVPGLLMAMAWTLVLSPNIGWLNAMISAGLGRTAPVFDIYSMSGMIWALASHNFPLAYLMLAPAFRVIDRRVEEAAIMAGAGGLGVLARVSLPLLRPAMLSTLLLLFIRGMESFEVPRIIGLPAHIDVFTTEIQDATSTVPPEPGIAAVLSLTLLALSLLGIYFYRRATRDAASFAIVTGKAYLARPIALGRWRWSMGAAMALLFAVALGLPLATLVWQSFFRNVTPPAASSLAAASLANYRYIATYPVFLRAAGNSLLLGAAGASLVVLLTFVMAWIAQRATPRWAVAVDALIFIPIAVPSVIVGAAILFAYLVLPIPIYDTLWILLVAYVTLHLPYGMRFAAGGFAQIHRELEEVAEVSGAGVLAIFRRVLLPLLAPMMIAAWLYVFVLVVRELAASFFLVGPQTSVLATLSLTLWDDGGSIGAICALGALEIAGLAVVAFAMRRFETAVGAGAFTRSSRAAGPA
ncbi:MAG TPA: iron ABC transporter permease [Stellaceae bacterium]|nr:iron ABC transporter permease [Stellaceae bacterium]